MNTNYIKFDEDTVSDLHKDAYGFRPREGFWNEWHTASLDEKGVIWDRLVAALDESIKEDERREQEAIDRFERKIDQLLAEPGVRSREYAIRMMFAASDARGDWDYFAWSMGLPYSYFQEMK
jgi:hypothetical protein